MIPGLRWSADITHVPTLTRDVTAATAPAIETPSQNPWGRRPPGSHSSSSGVQTVSKPIASARRAIARRSRQRAVTRSGPYCPVVSTTPISNERTGSSPATVGPPRGSGPVRRTVGVANSAVKP